MNFDYIIKQVENNNHSAFFYTPTIYKKAVSYLFLNPIEIIIIKNKEDLEKSFKKAQKLIDKKYSGYTLVKYEAGYLFEKKFNHFIDDDQKSLIEFYFFEKKEINKLKSSKIIFDDFFDNTFSVSNFLMNRSETEFQNDIEKIKHYIK